MHASAVSVAGAGVLLIGASGSGKSSLALELMARGATLVADDRVLLHDEDGHLIASCPARLRGMIEARGVGILEAEAAEPVPVRLVIDLDRTETERLPPQRVLQLLGHDVTLFHKVESPHFAAAVLQYMKAGRKV